LLSIALVAVAAVGCLLSSEPETPEIPDFPDIPELGLSEASDRARVERTLPWVVVEETCSGIVNRNPIIEFASVAGTDQSETTENLEINEYSGEVWKSSRLLMDFPEGSKHPRSFYATITYYESEGWASFQHEQFGSLGFETTPLYSALIVQSSPNDFPPFDERMSDQIFVIDDRVVSQIVVAYGSDVEPLCSRDELYDLAEQLVAGIR
jgi:hypothetical protein